MQNCHFSFIWPIISFEGLNFTLSVSAMTNDSPRPMSRTTRPDIILAANVPNPLRVTSSPAASEPFTAFMKPSTA